MIHLHVLKSENTNISGSVVHMHAQIYSNQVTKVHVYMFTDYLPDLLSLSNLVAEVHVTTLYVL